MIMPGRKRTVKTPMPAVGSVNLNICYYFFTGGTLQATLFKIRRTLKVPLVELWLLKKTAVSCGKTAVRKQPWEKQKAVWLEVLSNYR
jgi:hypothetical protein